MDKIPDCSSFPIGTCNSTDVDMKNENYLEGIEKEELLKERFYGKQYDACPCSKPGTQDRGCGYFMWMDDLRLHISSSSESSAPLSSYPGTSTRPSYSPGTSRSAQNLGKAECSNCKFLAEKIKTLEAKIKILEGALEMERHPEKHTLESAAILHELYNDMGKLGLE
ncbi:hypothetical protein Tco_0543879 [Tanacetum coccineum]